MACILVSRQRGCRTYVVPGLVFHTILLAILLAKSLQGCMHERHGQES